MHTKITQEDIFYYLFNKEKLSVEKIEFLDSNFALFQNEINLCKQMFSKPDTEINLIAQSISDKLINKKIIELYPQTIHSEETGKVILAAATSSEVKLNHTSFSFCDKEFNYLVRIVNYSDVSQLYLFPQNNNTPHLSVKIYPSENEYSISDFTKPINILSEEVIEKIVIKKC